MLGYMGQSTQSQGIFVILPTRATDKEKCCLFEHVTFTLNQRCWPNVPVQTVTEKASLEKKFLCTSHSGLSDFVRSPTYLVPLLDVLTLILISKAKVE